MTQPVDEIFSSAAAGTLEAYASYATAAIKNWKRLGPSALLRRFARRLPPGARVLDYGCGIGTDAVWLARRGARVEALDGTKRFVLEARRRGAQARHERFETARLDPARYDGIWCQAALIHVPPPELARQLEKLRRALVPGGWLGLSLAWGRRKAVTIRDWIPGRYIAGYSKAEARRLLGAWTVEELRVVSDDGRQGRWIQALAQP